MFNLMSYDQNLYIKKVNLMQTSFIDITNTEGEIICLFALNNI